jgi:hypothetical protein
VTATPDPPVSAAGSETETIDGYQPVHAPPLQRMAVVGAVGSTWISCAPTASALPALSQERNRTVVVAFTAKGAV